MSARKTHEQFLKEVDEIHGDNKFVLLTEYKNKRAKVKVKHEKCGYIWEILPEGLRRINGCPNCQRERPRIAPDEYRQMVFDKYGDKYTIIDDYKNARVSLLTRCNLCGNEWSIWPHAFIHRDDCDCSQCKQIERSQYVKHYIEVESGYGCILMSEYKHSHSPITLMCKCGRNTFETTYNHFLGNGRKQCIQCDIEQQYDKIANAIAKKKCGLLSNEYIDCFKPLSIKCRCGNIFITSFTHFTDGTNTMCQDCKSKKKLKVMKEFVRNNSESILISTKYFGQREPYLFKCSCGEIFETSFDSFKKQNKRRCNKCTARESNNEYQVRKALESLGLNFAQEYRFKNCRNIYPLPFDFAVFDEAENRLLFLIEVDGEHHFKPVTFSGIDKDRANKRFKKRKVNDTIKTEYCIDNKIKLIRIPYWQVDEANNIIKKALA